MALILKSEKTFVDAATGGNYPQAYLKIGKISYDRDSKDCSFFLLTYASQADRDLNRMPVNVQLHKVTESNFIQFFTPAALDSGSNIVAEIYGYLLQISDDQGLVYQDWESDVV